MNRRELFAALAGVVGVGAIGACGSGGDAEIDAPPNCLANGARTVIGANHPSGQNHTFIVTTAEIQAGADKTYDITGYADHAHDVSLSAADFATLAGNGSVMTTSSVAEGHSHSITVRCN